MANLYAIGFKGWVEVRKGEKPPRKVVSNASKHLKTTRREYQGMGVDYLPIFTLIEQESELKLEVTYFVGGKVVGRVPSNRFSKRWGFKVGKDQMIPIDPSMTLPLLEYLAQHNYLKVTSPRAGAHPKPERT